MNEPISCPVPPKERKRTHYCVSTHRKTTLPDGRPIILRVNLRIGCPHDAVLETTLERIELTAFFDQPGATPFNHFVRGGNSRNLSSEEAIP
jgi:hypothetical protein